MFHTIVIATDVSEASDHVIGCLNELRECGVKKAVLVHALGVRHIKEMAHLLALMVEPKLAKQKAALESQGFETVVEIAQGLPSIEVNRIAEEHEASLIVAGSHGTTCGSEILLGGVALAVLHHATIPVLLIRLKVNVQDALRRCEAACRNLRQHILFATDFSDTAEHAFTYVQKLAECGPSRITLLHVQDKSKIDKHLKEKLEEFNKIDAERLEWLKADIEKRGAKDIRIELPYGLPKKEIIDYAKLNEVTLIVMGSQGRGFISEMFLGSVSHAVARYSEVPVLLVPAIR
jgi:nucleotide-binding universal stress UspA family protein